MLTLTEIFAIIIIHWVSDFVLQTDKQAKGKSKNWSDLLNHTFIYSMCWSISFPLWILDDVGTLDYRIFYFILITFICHTITDYFTSRLNSRLWEQKKVHNFFVSIGFDQVLHYIQLFTTYYLLKC
jgi:hypothetical protein